MTLTAPFPYFGGKGRIASLVWQRLGDTNKHRERLWLSPGCVDGGMLI